MSALILAEPYVVPNLQCDSRIMRTYALIKPIFGMREDTRELLHLPIGALITLMIDPNRRLGICLATWQGSRIMVFGHDVENNGRPAE